MGTYPIWSILIIVLGIIIIYQLTARWDTADSYSSRSRSSVSPSSGDKRLGDGGAHLPARLQAVVDRLQVDDHHRRHALDHLADLLGRHHERTAVPKVRAAPVDDGDARAVALDRLLDLGAPDGVARRCRARRGRSR